MKRIALLFTIWLGTSNPANPAFSCSAVCWSKLASAVSIAANGKAIAAGIHKVRHPQAKAHEIKISVICFSRVVSVRVPRFETSLPSLWPLPKLKRGQ